MGPADPSEFTNVLDRSVEAPVFSNAIDTGRIDMVVENTNFIYVLELKLSNNGGVDAAT